MVTRRIVGEILTIKEDKPYVMLENLTIPDKKLGIGGHPMDLRKLERKIAVDKKRLKWTEPTKFKVFACKMCGKEIERKHSTQKYCKDCAAIVKRTKTSLRVLKHRKAGAVIKRGKYGELYIDAVFKNQKVVVLIPALYTENLNVATGYVNEHYKGRTKDLLITQLLGFFKVEKQ